MKYCLVREDGLFLGRRPNGRWYYTTSPSAACRADFQVAEETDIYIIRLFYRVHDLDDFLAFHGILLSKRTMKNVGKDEQRFRMVEIP